ncbi:Uncharacterised protein [Pasteurella multocida]|nr:Uncharacterised protein [Pasteurella multocida]
MGLAAVEEQITGNNTLAGVVAGAGSEVVAMVIKYINLRMGKVKNVVVLKKDLNRFETSNHQAGGDPHFNRLSQQIYSIIRKNFLKGQNIIYFSHYS